MRSFAVTAVVAAAFAQSVVAFSNTSPIVAWSSERLESLSLLNPAHSSHKVNVFRPATPQTPFPASSSTSPISDLCSASSILLISLPGLHSSDLAHLPASLQAHLASATEGGRSLSVPYVEHRQRSVPEKVAKQFVSECGAVVQKEGHANVWGGEERKTVLLDEVAGLDEWELVGANARKERKSIIEGLESRLQGHLATLQAPYIVVLTALPKSHKIHEHSSVRSKAHQHNKRQFDVDPDTGAVTVDEETVDATPFSSGTVVAEGAEVAADQEDDFFNVFSSGELQQDDDKKDENRTSIFAVKPNSGLLHRYVFFTPPLIFGLLITLFILIPALIITTQALTSTETVNGLETKMTGTTGAETK